MCELQYDKKTLFKVLQIVEDHKENIDEVTYIEICNMLKDMSTFPKLPPINIDGHYLRRVLPPTNLEMIMRFENHVKHIDKSITLNAQFGVVLNVGGNTTGILIDDNIADVTVDGFNIIGDNLTGSGITVNPGANNITLSNNTISNILLPGGGNASPLSYGILCWGNPSSGINPPTNINITGNNISYVLGSAISLGTNTENVTISGNSFSNIIPVQFSTTYLAVGVQAELSNNLTIQNNNYDALLQANNLAHCTNTSISSNTYVASPLMLNTTYPHVVSFNDTPWWSLIYATTPTDYFQAYYSDTTSTAYQTLVSTYAALGVPLWSTLNSSNPGCTDSLALNYDAAYLSDDGSCIFPMTYVPDDTFEQALIDLGLDSGPLNDSVQTAAIDTVENLFLTALGIFDLTGIEGFSSLVSLYCDANSIYSIDVSNNQQLEILYCQGNPITSLDLSNNITLTDIHCGSMPGLNYLDLSANINLKWLNASFSSLEACSTIRLSSSSRFTEALVALTSSLEASRNRI